MSGERSLREEHTISQPIVFLVDDDPAVHRAIASVLHARGWVVRAFGSAQEFLAAHNAAADDPAAAECIILDLALSGTDGLQLQERLAAEGCQSPIIFLTAYGDIRASVRALKAGALDVLKKPVKKAQLLRAIDDALNFYAEQRHLRSERSTAEHRLSTLTQRERQVIEHVMAGRLNKQIAADLGVAEDTVKMHRGRAMRKLGVRSVAELVRFMLRVVSVPAAGYEALECAALREPPRA